MEEELPTVKKKKKEKNKELFCSLELFRSLLLRCSTVSWINEQVNEFQV